VVVEYDKDVTDRYGKTLGKKQYNLNKFRRSNQDTSINQKPLVVGGEIVTTATCWPTARARPTASSPGQEPARGVHAVEGYNYEERDHLERAPRA